MSWRKERGEVESQVAQHSGGGEGSGQGLLDYIRLKQTLESTLSTLLPTTLIFPLVCWRSTPIQLWSFRVSACPSALLLFDHAITLPCQPLSTAGMRRIRCAPSNQLQNPPQLTRYPSTVLPSSAYSQGNEAFKAGDYQLAIKHYSAAIHNDIDPGDPVGLFVSCRSLSSSRTRYSLQCADWPRFLLSSTALLHQPRPSLLEAQRVSTTGSALSRARTHPPSAVPLLQYRLRRSAHSLSYTTNTLSTPQIPARRARLHLGPLARPTPLESLLASRPSSQRVGYQGKRHCCHRR